jgi:hypothetical protein
MKNLPFVSVRTLSSFLTVLALFCVVSSPAAAPFPAGTEALHSDSDLSSEMVAGIDRMASRFIANSRRNRQPTREQLASILGVVDKRLPFSALDFEMTLFIREKLQEVFMQTGTTMMLVSHDLEEAVYLADQILLLTKRPTSVAEILQYDDPRPRTVATLTEPSFVAAKKRSLEIFQQEVRR